MRALRWWTFAGQRINTAPAKVLGALRKEVARGQNLAIQLKHGGTPVYLRSRLATIEANRAAEHTPVIDAAIDGLKFSACLPRPLAYRTIATRMADPLWQRKVVKPA